MGVISNSKCTKSCLEAELRPNLLGELTGGGRDCMMSSAWERAGKGRERKMEGREKEEDAWDDCVRQLEIKALHFMHYFINDFIGFYSRRR